jgi:hypothetical protein
MKQLGCKGDCETVSFDTSTALMSKMKPCISRYVDVQTGEELRSEAYHGGDAG